MTASWPVLPPGAAVATDRIDPREDWPPQARTLHRELTDRYGTGDALPDVAGGWIARQRSHRTRTNYARHFRVWEEYARTRDVHPLAARLTLADAYARHLEVRPTLVRVPGAGRQPVGPPLGDASRAAMLSAASSFYTYAHRLELVPGDPFAAVPRPQIDPDHSPNPGVSQVQLEAMLQAALAHPMPAYRARSYLVLLLLYTQALRADSLTGADVADLGYRDGHRVLTVRLKGGRTTTKPLPPYVAAAVDGYLDGRTDGPLIATRTGNRLDEPALFRLVRMTARRAGLDWLAERIGPHALKHAAVTEALEHHPLHVVQDFADHKDPRTTRRYDRRRNNLHSSPAHGLAASLAGRLTPNPTPHPSPEPAMDTCPRCRGPLKTSPADTGSGSRMVTDRAVRICGHCGTDEAVRDAAGMAPVPFGEWPITGPHMTWATAPGSAT